MSTNTPTPNVPTSNAPKAEAPKVAFNVLKTLTAEQVSALETLLSLRFKSKEVNALESMFPGATGAELFIVAKMQELADNEIAASVWRKFREDWKREAASYARNVNSEDKESRTFARKAIVRLGQDVPRDKVKDVLAHVIKVLDRGSEDARVLEFKRIFDTGETTPVDAN